MARRLSRVARFLERRGILARDEDNSYLTLDGLEEDPLQDIHSHSVTYQVAIGSRKGPLDFLARLVALAPKPRVSLTRFHGVFAPNNNHPAAITPSGRGEGRCKSKDCLYPDDKTAAERDAAMTGFCSCKTGIHANHGNNLGAVA